MRSDIFLVQVGHNGFPLTQQAIEEKYADGAILSPSDYDLQKNQELAEFIHARSGIVLFDNHWYIPRSDRPKLTEYEYFRHFGGDGYDTSLMEDKNSREKLCNEIISIQDSLDVDAYLSPAVYIDTFSDTKIQRYVELSRSFIECKQNIGRDIPCFATLPISSHVLINADDRKDLLDYITTLDCDGFYISVGVEDGEGYPLSRLADVASMINFVYSLKMNKYYVLMGHSHHLSYLLLCAGIDGFSTGHYKNLRTFNVSRWDTEASGGRFPALNYFSVPLLNDLRVDSDLEFLYQSSFELEKIKSKSPFENQLFEQSPTLSGWRYRDSWDHYIWSCHHLLERLKKKNLQERIEEVDMHLKNANELYQNIQNEVGILTQPDERIYTSWKSAIQILRNLISL